MPWFMYAVVVRCFHLSTDVQAGVRVTDRCLIDLPPPPRHPFDTAFLLSVVLLQGNRWHIAPALCMAWTFMFSWLAVFRHFEVTNPLFYWLPLGPVVLFGLAVYIYSAAQKTERELDELGQMRYNHKEL